MWHSDHSHTPEEIEVLRELEYDLFMANPGFRKMWDDNFQDYFRALFDEQAWKTRQEEREGKFEDNMTRRMIEDPEFAAFMRHEALIDSVLLGDIPIDNAPLDIQQEVRQIQSESEEMSRNMELEEMFGIEPKFDDPFAKDPLVGKAYDWGHELGNLSGTLYEQTKNIDLFRISNNCSLVGSKIMDTDPAAAPELGYKKQPWEWQLDRVDCNLALKSLKRCIESLERLKKQRNISSKLNIKKFLSVAKDLQAQLINRLGTIEQEQFKSLK